MGKKISDEKDQRTEYVKPKTKKHDPLDIVRGSTSTTSSYGSGLYTVVLYYYY